MHDLLASWPLAAVVITAMICSMLRWPPKK